MDNFYNHPVKINSGIERVLFMKTDRMKKMWIPGLLVIILGSAGAWYWYTQLHGYVSTDDAMVDGFQSTISSNMI